MRTTYRLMNIVHHIMMVFLWFSWAGATLSLMTRAGAISVFVSRALWFDILVFIGVPIWTYVAPLHVFLENRGQGRAIHYVENEQEGRKDV